MFRKVTKWVAEATRSEDDRLSEFLDGIDDPIAREVEWSAASSGGANFRTHRLKVVSPVRAEFRLAFGAMLFCWIFFVIGLVAMGFGVASLTGMLAQGPPWWFIFPFGLIFGGVGAGMWWAMSRPRVFDMQDLWYWRGKRPLDREAVERCEDSAPLDLVHAIQIIRERVSGNDSSYNSYEINLVLHDGRRVNVVDHGNLKHIRKDAQAIGELIGVPVWDATA